MLVRPLDLTSDATACRAILWFVVVWYAVLLQVDGQLGQMHASNVLGSLQVVIEDVVGDVLRLSQEQPSTEQRVRFCSAQPVSTGSIELVCDYKDEVNCGAHAIVQSCTALQLPASMAPHAPLWCMLIGLLPSFGQSPCSFALQSPLSSRGAQI